MKNSTKLEYPNPEKVVLAFSKSESMWIPVYWCPKQKFWICEFRSGMAQVFEPQDIARWMEMLPTPCS